MLGSEDGGGSAGQAGSSSSGQTSSGGGGSVSTAGSAHAGTPSSGGTGSGGTAAGGTTNGGSAGSGGASCEAGLCVRPNTCLSECGGDVVYTGCCQCEAGTVEQLSCSANGGQGSGGQASADCVGKTCTSSQTCVAYRTVGGAIFPPDAQGQCTTGKHLEGNNCQSDFGYTCAELSGCSAPAATCRCAQNTQCSNTTVCRLPSDSAWLDKSADLVCELQAP